MAVYDELLLFGVDPDADPDDHSNDDPDDDGVVPVPDDHAWRKWWEFFPARFPSALLEHVPDHTGNWVDPARVEFDRGVMDEFADIIEQTHYQAAGAAVGARLVELAAACGPLPPVERWSSWLQRP
jgi:hypothetical protein